MHLITTQEIRGLNPLRITVYEAKVVAALGCGSRIREFESPHTPMVNKEYKAIGDVTEARYKAGSLAEGCKIKEASIYEDINEKFDFYKEYPDGRILRVDVKTMKKYRKTDTEAKLVIVELLNKGGGVGSAYGKADIFALEQPWGFVEVDRLELLKLALSLRLMNSKGAVARGWKYYHTHSTRGNKDEMILIKMDDVLTLNSVRLMKCK